MPARPPDPGASVYQLICKQSSSTTGSPVAQQALAEAEVLKMKARNLSKKFRRDIVWKRKKWGKEGRSYFCSPQKRSVTPTSFLLVKGCGVWHFYIAPNFESTLGGLSFDFDAQPDMYQDRRNVRGWGGGEIINLNDF